MRKKVCLATFILVAFAGGAGAPGHAFNCAKAETRTEKTICQNPELKAADDAMSAAYVAARNRLNPHHRQGLSVSQRLWLKQRDNRCDFAPGEPGLRECLFEITRERGEILRLVPAAGPNIPGGFAPLAFAQEGSRKRYEVSVLLPRVASVNLPGLREFNREMTRLSQGTPANDKIDFEPLSTLSFHLTGRITYASSKLVSAQLRFWRYDGGAHGNYGTSGVTVDPRTGPLRFTELLDRRAHEQLADDCSRQILIVKRDRFSDFTFDNSEVDIYRDTILDHVGDFRHWTFHGGHALVHFDPYAVGAFAEGSFECRIDYTILRPLLKRADFLPG